MLDIVCRISVKTGVPAIEPFYIKLGRLLYAARSKSGLSQEQLGQRLTPKMTRASIANIETGKQRVLAKTLVDLARELKVDIVTLIPEHIDHRPISAPHDIQAKLQNVLPNLPTEKVKALARKIESQTKRNGAP